jgi:hypothetical protein
VSFFGFIVSLIGISILLELIRSYPNDGIFLAQSGTMYYLARNYTFPLLVAAFFGTFTSLFATKDLIIGFSMALNSIVAINSLYEASAGIYIGLGKHNEASYIAGFSLIFIGAFVSAVGSSFTNLEFPKKSKDTEDLKL